jgi:hypothetical protein
VLSVADWARDEVLVPAGIVVKDAPKVRYSLLMLCVLAFSLLSVPRFRWRNRECHLGAGSTNYEEGKPRGVYSSVVHLNVLVSFLASLTDTEHNREDSNGNTDSCCCNDNLRIKPVRRKPPMPQREVSRSNEHEQRHRCVDDAAST